MRLEFPLEKEEKCRPYAIFSEESLGNTVTKSFRHKPYRDDWTDNYPYEASYFCRRSSAVNDHTGGCLEICLYSLASHGQHGLPVYAELCYR
jgi:hypothetical protein